MKYDFETLVSRKGKGSYKWGQMYDWNPNVADDTVPLSVADMELKCSPELMSGLKDFVTEDLILGYSGPTVEYYEAVKGWMKKRHNYEIQNEWIVNSAGIVSAFYAAVRAFTEKGDGVIIMPPVYYPFFNAINLAGRTIARNPLVNTNGHYSINFEHLEEVAKDPKNKILLFCSPHNPVGRVWTKEELEKVGEICLRNNVLIVSDEIHNDLVMPGYNHTVFATISKEIENNTITCTAPSKTFNVAGLCCSNIIISNPDIREKFQLELANTASHMVGIFGYKGCEIAYNTSEEWLEELLTVIDRNQKLVNEYFKTNFPKITAPLIEGTYLQWMDFSALGMSNEEMEVFMHFKAEAFFDEGYIFGEEGNGFERINLAAPTWVIENTLKKLGEALKEVYK
jgi:aminotransferase/cystathionine beta-lyase